MQRFNTQKPEYSFQTIPHGTDIVPIHLASMSTFPLLPTPAYPVTEPCVPGGCPTAGGHGIRHTAPSLPPLSILGTKTPLDLAVPPPFFLGCAPHSYGAMTSAKRCERVAAKHDGRDGLLGGRYHAMRRGECG